MATMLIVNIDVITGVILRNENELVFTCLFCTTFAVTIQANMMLCCYPRK